MHLNFNGGSHIKIQGLHSHLRQLSIGQKGGLFDRNKSLWGGWFFQFNDYAIYHAGDTGYSSDFITTKEVLGSPKYALIPIGAYDPEWFMASSHVNPEDAVKIMLDLEADCGNLVCIGEHLCLLTKIL